MTKTHEIKLDGYGAHTTLAEDRPIMLLGTAESYGIETLHVVSGKSWEGLTVTATFNAPDGTSTDMLMSADGSITVPSEATAKSGSGKIVFSGVSDGVQRISCDLEYFVVAHSAINGVQSGGTAPSWFEQAAARFMPTGGTAGQVLTKLTNTDFDAGWQNSQGGAGTTDHSQLINRDIADQHPISAITGLEEALTLTGTTETLTPMQVYDAIKSGKSVVLQHTFPLLGLLTFASFTISEEEKVVVSTLITKLEDIYFVCSLAGLAETDGAWVFNITEMAKADDIPVAVNEALAAAKANGEFDGADGQDGVTPTIGDNGNWYLGETDTGKPSRGEKGDKGDKGDTGETGATGAAGAAGADGKSAYAYAQDGGYTGTEAEFAAKLAKEKFANPNALTFTGAVEGSYDGSAPLEVAIPNGGGSGFDKWECINTFTIPADTAEDVTSITFSEDAEGKPFALKKFYAVFAGITGVGTYFCIRINDLHLKQQFSTDVITGNNFSERNPLRLYFEIAGSGLYHWSCTNDKSFGYRADGDITPFGGTQSNISQINKISFYWGTKDAITPGTTVKLLGVRM